MTSRLLRAFLVIAGLTAVLAAAGWLVATVPAVRAPVVEALNAAGDAYIRFVFRLYRMVDGGADGPD